jgi:hypothetical protein
MSNPNLAAVTSILGNVGNVALTTSAQSLASNAASSSTILKVESIIVANSTASAVTVTVNIYSQAALAGTAYPIASGLSIPAYSQVPIVDKSTSFYLMENMSLGALAGSNSALTTTTTWEVMS